MHEFYNKCKNIEEENKDNLVDFQEDYPGVLNVDNLEYILKAARAKKMCIRDRTYICKFINSHKEYC